MGRLRSADSCSLFESIGSFTNYAQALAFGIHPSSAWCVPLFSPCTRIRHKAIRPTRLPLAPSSATAGHVCCSFAAGHVRSGGGQTGSVMFPPVREIQRSLLMMCRTESLGLVHNGCASLMSIISIACRCLTLVHSGAAASRAERRRRTRNSRKAVEAQKWLRIPRGLVPRSVAASARGAGLHARSRA